MTTLVTAAPAPPTRRLALVLIPPGVVAGVPPPGVDATEWSRALVEDGYEVLAGLAQTRAGLAGGTTDLAALADLTWPDCVLVDTAAAPPGTATVAVADLVAATTDRLVLLAPDAPDLPGLHIGKLFQALEHADLAWCPVADGGVAALGLALPLAGWVRGEAPGLDGDPHSWTAAAPRRLAVAAAPGWHRLRSPGDLRHLDPGLSGWETTRALLSGHPLGA